jgi:peptide/nickel transport system permease protein
MQRNRAHYVARRTLAALLMVVVAVTLNFAIFRALPGDASASFGSVPQATPEMRQQLREEFGLSDPVPTQFVKYLEQLGHGNLGISTVDRQPVTDRLRETLVNTLPLVLGATIVAILVGLVTGTLAAWRQGGVSDPAATGLALALNAMPVQWLGLVLIVGFSSWFASGGIHDPFLVGAGSWGRFVDYLRHLVLPLTTLALALFGSFHVIVRSAVLETLGEDYVLTARAKGLSTARILRRYALRNALLPTATLIALTLGFVVGGAVLVETVFSWPGVGRAVYDAVTHRDFPMLQGAFLVLTLSVVFFTYLADLLYMWLDPRVAAA